MSYTLAFETSCDETCVSVIDSTSTGALKVLSNVVSSQIDIHKLYGGVVPEIASRNHALAIQTVYEEALTQAGITLQDVTQIAATTTPGLRGAVMIGQVFAESLANACKVPFTEVNHLAGHIASVKLTHADLNLPFLTLLVSGGHTSLYKVEDWNNIKLLCETIDDACGEAFDKVARLLDLEYPGGVQIEKYSEQYQGDDLITFVKKPSKKDTFTYSGLKTAVLNHLNRAKQKGEQIDLPQICASFQQEAIEQLATRCEQHMRKYNIETLCVCGGVSANKLLRKRLPNAFFPEFKYCTDNAAMIGAAAVLGIKL